MSTSTIVIIDDEEYKGNYERRINIKNLLKTLNFNVRDYAHVCGNEALKSQDELQGSGFVSPGKITLIHSGNKFGVQQYIEQTIKRPSGNIIIEFSGGGINATSNPKSTSQNHLCFPNMVSIETGVPELVKYVVTSLSRSNDFYPISDSVDILEQVDNVAEAFNNPRRLTIEEIINELNNLQKKIIKAGSHFDFDAKKARRWLRDSKWGKLEKEGIRVNIDDSGDGKWQQDWIDCVPMLGHELKREARQRADRSDRITIEVLLVDDHVDILNRIDAALTECFSKDKTYALELFRCENGEEAIKYIREGNNIQVVVVDYYLYDVQTSPSKLVYKTGTDVAKEIRKIRDTLPIILLTSFHPRRVLSGNYALFDAYFDKNEICHDKLYRKIVRIVEQKSRLPYFSALKTFSLRPVDSFHALPAGHSDSLRKSKWNQEILKFYGENYFRAECTTTSQPLDSLLNPTGNLAEAQNLAAKAFGAKNTYFVTNGTSTSNKIVLQAIIKPGDIVLIDRNCHKSNHYSILLSHANPIYLEPTRLGITSSRGKFQTLGTCGTVSKKIIYAALDQNEDAAVLILTNCTFDGLIYDIPEIAKKVEIINKKRKEKNQTLLKFFVDEAWFAFANFHPQFKARCAMNAGAHYATQSTHKTLSAFRQGSMIHVRDPDHTQEPYSTRFSESFYTHTSTSPHYGILASLDAARMQMEMEGYELVDGALKLATELRNGINQGTRNVRHYFKVLEEDDFKLKDVYEWERQNDGSLEEKESSIASLSDNNVLMDPTKVTLWIKKPVITGLELKAQLLDHDIQVNKFTFNSILINVGIGATLDSIYHLINILLRLADTFKENDNFQKTKPLHPNLEFPWLEYRYNHEGKCKSIGGMTTECTPGEVPHHELLQKCPIRIGDLNSNLKTKLDQGKIICATLMVPYPPGIPVLTPGQIVTAQCLVYLLSLAKANVEIHGFDRSKNEISVIVL